MSLALAAAAMLGAAASQPQARRTWTPKFVVQYGSFSNHSQYGAVVVERGQTWFFGGSNVTGPGTPKIAYRKNGHWQSPPALPSGLHSWIVAASGTSPRDIWAVTFLGGSVLRWNGTAWTSATRGGWRAGTQFTGILALSAANVWLFGASGPHHAGAGTWHWSGRAWSRVGGAAAGLAQASAASPTDLWAVGSRQLARFNGTSWHQVHPGTLAGFRYRRVLALSPGNVWVAGTLSGSPELGHFDGHGWTAVRVPGLAPATGMCRDGSGGLWVIANSGKTPTGVLHRSAAGRWSFARVGSSAKDEVLACAWVPGTTAAWGAGKAAPPPGATGTAAAAYGTGPVP
jgi:hypothetical protein